MRELPVRFLEEIFKFVSSGLDGLERELDMHVSSSPARSGTCNRHVPYRPAGAGLRQAA